VSERYDAVVVGSGPNGLAAAITLARAGRSVLVLEAAASLGGGARSAELTLPGFVHDVCSAIHPLGAGSPFLRKLPLEEHGLEWIEPPVAVAHPFDDGGAAALERSIEATVATLGADAERYARRIGPLAARAQALLPDLLKPLWPPPRHPLLMARFGLPAIRSARAAALSVFQGERARGLFAGLAAHSVLPLEAPFSASFGYLFAILGHAVGWPLARGGSQAITGALAGYLRRLGGRIETGRRVASVAELPPARVVLFDLTPRQLLRIAGDRFRGRYRRALEEYRYGPGAFKLDLALSGPIPWRAEACRRAGTVHLGASLDEICASERAVARGDLGRAPYVIVAQQSLFDPARAPSGKHTAWAYCHVPNGSTADRTDAIESQIERFAPGFRELILARSVMAPKSLEAYNENYVGGDIAGGGTAFPQLFLRPAARLVPYSTPDPSLYLCSSSTPPGGGVHGMCGHLAALAALRAAFGATA